MASRALFAAALLAAGLWTGAALAAAHGVRVNCDVNPAHPDCQERTLPTPQNQAPPPGKTPPAAEQSTPKTGK